MHGLEEDTLHSSMGEAFRHRKKSPAARRTSLATIGPSPPPSSRRGTRESPRSRQRLAPSPLRGEGWGEGAVLAEAFEESDGSCRSSRATAACALVPPKPDLHVPTD